MTDREKYERAVTALILMLPYTTAYPDSPKWRRASNLAMECIADASMEGFVP